MKDSSICLTEHPSYIVGDISPDGCVDTRCSPAHRMSVGRCVERLCPVFSDLVCGRSVYMSAKHKLFAVAAKGKSRLLFYWSIYKWSFLLLCLFVGMNFESTGCLGYDIK